MIFELVVTVVMVAFDGRFLDRPVHAFDLPIGPRMLDLGEPVLDAVFPGSASRTSGSYLAVGPSGALAMRGVPMGVIAAQLGHGMPTRA